jgi:hypothetical protein
VPARKGQKRTPGSGRKAGVPNKVTATVKSVFEQTFKDMQKDPKQPHALGQWAKTEPAEFYKLAAKLIPQDIKANLTGNVTLTPNVNLIVEAMGANLAGALPPSGALTISTEPQGVNGKKPD